LSRFAASPAQVTGWRGFGGDTDSLFALARWLIQREVEVINDRGTLS
jgi:hypothetical protein